ncbi:hypothetical protein LY76DRAFT_157041 [Colletotrichum caudatum]|nr:hypothetical protein LY76DRAFT_157041 [Colletotrichum caudatum]
MWCTTKYYAVQYVQRWGANQSPWNTVERPDRAAPHKRREARTAEAPQLRVFALPSRITGPDSKTNLDHDMPAPSIRPVDSNARLRGLAWFGSAHFFLGIRAWFFFFFFNGTEPAYSYRPPLLHLVPTDSPQAGLGQDSLFLSVLVNQDPVLDARPLCLEP